MEDRFDRSVRFFGQEGQERLREGTAAVVGIGGIGTHVVQQLAFLGVGGLVLIDPEEVSESNRNRYVGLQHDDPVPGMRKVDLGERIAVSVDPSMRMHKTHGSVMSHEGIDALRKSRYVFGCVDCEGVRLFLTEACARYALPYVDAATDIISEEALRYGGRVCVAWDGNGCQVCLGVLDTAAAQVALGGEPVRRERAAIYGVEHGMLDTVGPSVVSLNGVIASVAVTEFMVGVTGLRKPRRLLTYRGHLGGLTVSNDDPALQCYYCKGLWGSRGGEELRRFWAPKHGNPGP